MARRLNDWLTSYLKYTDHSESPVSYHTWAGVSCIAAALQRRVYMRMGHSILYPNNYIILVGQSANTRKGEPLVIARDIVEHISTIKVLGEDSTPEALIRDMKGTEETFQDISTGNWKWQSAVTAFIEELAVFTGHQNTTFLAYLTNWYDSRNKWKRTTKHQGIDEIIGMCFNFIASTAPDWLPHILTKEAIGGGFTSRCIFIVEERKRKTVPDPNAMPVLDRLRDDLVHDLELIACLNGEYDWAPEAKASYEKWYKGEDEVLMAGGSLMGDPALDGYAGRRPAHVRKISMAASASRSDSMAIEQEDFDRALGLLTDAEKKMSRIFSGVGRGKYAAETDMVLNYVRKFREVSRSQLLRDLYRNLDEASFKSIIEVLGDMKLIQTRISSEDNETYYKVRD